MLELTLKRVISTNKHSHGILLADNSEFLCYTLELPWRNNERDISRIPNGKYKLVSHAGPRFGLTFLLKDVLHRSGIIFHGGNSTADTRGCILVGWSTRWTGAIASGKPAFEQTIKPLAAEHKEATLRIVEV